MVTIVAGADPSRRSPAGDQLQEGQSLSRSDVLGRRGSSHGENEDDSGGRSDRTAGWHGSKEPRQAGAPGPRTDAGSIEVPANREPRGRSRPRRPHQPSEPSASPAERRWLL